MLQPVPRIRRASAKRVRRAGGSGRGLLKLRLDGSAYLETQEKRAERGAWFEVWMKQDVQARLGRLRGPRSPPTCFTTLPHIHNS